MCVVVVAVIVLIIGGGGERLHADGAIPLVVGEILEFDFWKGVQVSRDRGWDRSCCFHLLSLFFSFWLVFRLGGMGARDRIVD